MSWHSLPLLMRVNGRPVILLGEGEAADAKRRLLERAGAVVVQVADDGAGPVVGAGGDGLGLAGMRERVALLGGTLATGPGPDGGGMVVTACLPLRAAAERAAWAP